MRIILNSINYDESVQKLFTSLSETIHRTIYRTDIYIKICYFSEYETPKNVCIFVVNTHIACKRNRAWLRPCNFRKRKQELDRPLASLLTIRQHCMSSSLTHHISSAIRNNRGTRTYCMSLSRTDYPFSNSHRHVIPNTLNERIKFQWLRNH